MINTPANLFQHCRSFTETTILPKYRLTLDCYVTIHRIPGILLFLGSLFCFLWFFHIKLSLTADLHSACKMHKRTLNLLIGLVLCIWSCDHYNVQSLTEGSFIQAVALSYQSGDSVAYHTIPNPDDSPCACHGSQAHTSPDTDLPVMFLFGILFGIRYFSLRSLSIPSDSPFAYFHNAALALS